MDTLEDVQLLAMAKHGDLVAKFLRRDDKQSGVLPVDMTKRLAIIFKNGWGLSVITGSHAHTSENKPFEICPLGKDGDLDHGLQFVEDPSNDTVGHCTMHKVMRYVKHIGEME